MHETIGSSAPLNSPGGSLKVNEGGEIMSSRNLEGQNQRHEKEYLSELFNFACILEGDVKYLEKIKEHIIQEYVNTGLVKLIRPTYDKKELYLLTNEEWDEYQKLKNKEPGLIGAGWL